jgi:hypothetical protein
MSTPSTNNETSMPAHHRTAEVPSLHELGVRDKTIPNIEYMNKDTEEDDLKRELLLKFELLKKANHNGSIPEYTIYSDYKVMKQTYDTIRKGLSIDKSVNQYKTYLVGGFMFVEYFLGCWMGFSMKGFTDQQISNMNSYEQLLIELGEKSYVEEESQWPVELRLLGLIVTNAALFIVSQLIAEKTGSNIMNMINSMNVTNNADKKKRKMKGPTLDLSGMPEASSA